MIVKERTKQEIEEKLKSMHDFVKMEYLESCLKQVPGLDIRRFILLKLVELYESRKMYPQAAKYMDDAAEIAITFKEKIQLYLKVIELYIKSGVAYFDRADEALNKALACGNSSEKEMIKMNVKQMYIKEAGTQMKMQKTAVALKFYERLLKIEKDEAAAREIKKTILPMYERLGKVREFFALKQQLGM